MKTQVAKEVTILARGQHKLNSKAVGYKVLSSDESTKYDVLIYDRRSASCNCPGYRGHKHCYHADQCLKIEVARYEAWQRIERAKLVEVLDSCSQQELTVAIPQPKIIQVPVLAAVIVKPIMAQIEAVARQASMEAEYVERLDVRVSQYESCENCGRNHQSWNCPL